jgi:hypothetical protein
MATPISTRLFAAAGTAQKASKGFEYVIKGINKIMFNKKVAFPALVGLFGMGTLHGFTKEMIHNPTTNALLSDYLSSGKTKADESGMPLGTTAKNYYYRPSGNDISATGQLALAMFATRHGR